MKKTARSVPQGNRPARAVAPAGRVRIIGGRYRRTPLAVPDVPGLRPTPDRVRETVFNWIQHLFGDIPEVRVLDLFAGSGALGFEMASRGARRVVLVDSDARAAAALRAVRDRLGAQAVDVILSDWRAAVAPMASASFDLIFLDPPFDSEILPQALAAAQRLLAGGGLIYAEAGAPIEADAMARLGLEQVRSGRAGAVSFHLLRTQSC